MGGKIGLGVNSDLPLNHLYWHVPIDMEAPVNLAIVGSRPNLGNWLDLVVKDLVKMVND